MTEQPAEHGQHHVQITAKNAIAALTKFTLMPEVVDQVLAKLPTSMNRFEAEDLAWRIGLSSLLCLEVGLSAEADAELFRHADWQEVLTKMLRVYDETDKPEVEL